LQEEQDLLINVPNKVMQNSIGSGESKDNSIKKLSNEDNGKTEEKKEPAQRRRKNRGKKN
jgi:hypothetical protein